MSDKDNNQGEKGDDTENGGNSGTEGAIEPNHSKDRKKRKEARKAKKNIDDPDMNYERSSEEEKEKISDSQGSAPIKGQDPELIEVTDVKLLRELKEQRNLYPEFVKSRQPDQTIDEIKGHKTTGTSKFHKDDAEIDMVKDKAQVRHKGIITKFHGIGLRTAKIPIPDPNQSKKTIKENTDAPKTEIVASGSKPLKFPIEESIPEIPGDPQTVPRIRLVKIGRRNKKTRCIGVNTLISRRPEKVVPRISLPEDPGIYRDEGTRRDVGQNTKKLRKSRKRSALKPSVESDDHPIDIGPTLNEAREIGVNTKVLPKVKVPPISEPYKHFNDRYRDIGSHVDHPYKIIDDGTNVSFMETIKSKRSNVDELIVKSPPEIDLYKIHERGDGRTYYPGCEYHFPGTNTCRRLFYKFRRRYEPPPICDWLLTLIFAVLYITFVVIFSMAWFDIIANDEPQGRSIGKMAQPFVNVAPVGRHPNLRTISFDPRNDSDVSVKYSDIMRLLQKYDYENAGKMERFGSCTPSNKFGYASGQPCVFLKVNRVLGFKTEPYTHADEVFKRTNLSNDEYLALKSLLQDNSTSEVDRQNRTWITCSTGQHKDVQIAFHPEPAIKTEYTDIEEESIVSEVGTGKRKTLFGPEDLNRIVALEIKNLKENEQVHVSCKLWAHNIHHEKEDYGQVAFYLVLLADQKGEISENVLKHHDDSL
nr:uncharacterized protein LOC121502481 [Drosophila kikkawai]